MAKSRKPPKPMTAAVRKKTASSSKRVSDVHRAVVDSLRKSDSVQRTRFRVEIENTISGAFISVRGMETITEVVSFQDGTDSMRFKPGRTSYRKLILTRIFDGGLNLYQWRKSVTDGRVNRRNGKIILLDEGGGELLGFNFFEAWPCRWKIFQHDGSTEGDLLEEIEMVVEKTEVG